MSYIPSTDMRPTRPSRSSGHALVRVAGYGAFAVALAFSFAVVLGLVP